MASPNIVVLFTDQQQAASVHPESSCRTPTLDTFSESGTRFDRCYSPNPICSPSRASFMTGVLPHVHGMINVTHGVEPYGAQFQSELDTWSERLSDAGYTNGYFGKWHVERSGDLDKFGFDNYGILRSDDFQSIFHEHRSSLGLPPEPDRSPEGYPTPSPLNTRATKTSSSVVESRNRLRGWSITSSTRKGWSSFVKPPNPMVHGAL
ncbi:sulfatase-like hydrolase/transferase [Halomicroarcula sp. GCM10025710]